MRSGLRAFLVASLALLARATPAHGDAPLPRPPYTAEGSSEGGTSLRATSAWNTSILIGTHHKTGTVLLAKVFRQASKIMGVLRTKSNRTLSSACSDLLTHSSPGVCIIEHVSARDVRSWLRTDAAWPPFVHAVRDPLEMCVSAYQYHLLGAEPWLTQPLRDLNGSTLQQHYKALPPESGVRFECKRMVLELIETALVFNATRSLPNVLTVRLEDFSRGFDTAMRSLFKFLGSGKHVDALVKAAAQYDLARAPAEDTRHVSASTSKQPLRDMLMRDPLLGPLLADLRSLLGYRHERSAGVSDAPTAPNASGLCEVAQAICATTRVGFFQWCSYGRLLRGRLPSLPECGDPAHTGKEQHHSSGDAAAEGPGTRRWEQAEVGVG